MPKEYKYDGETFLLDDSKGCYIEVTYEGLTGYVGVNLSSEGTQATPYAWAVLNHIGGVVVDDGLNDGLKVSTIEEGLRRLCNWLIQHHTEQQAHKAFDREKACGELHEFYEKLPN